MGVQVVLDRLRQEPLLVVPGGLVAVDVRQAHLQQDGADVLVLELDGALAAGVQAFAERLVVLRLAEGRPPRSSRSMSK